jgi:5-oxoprolinase (ATP-hydrolysing) subunit A
MLSIDLNCDMGEGFAGDADIMPFISSVNIACGYHAGDAGTMRRTVELALQYGVAIGAHPSYPDREHFGRVDMVASTLRPEELPAIIIDQLLQLQEICHQAGTVLHHVKPHGALYNRAAWDGSVGSYICHAVHEVNASLFLYGLSGSEMKTEAAAYQLQFVHEVFADRTYQDDGSLTPRSHPNALITNVAPSIQQVLQMVQQGTVRSVSGKDIPVVAQTICIHGDGIQAAAFAKAIYSALVENGIKIQFPHRAKD